MSTVPVLPLTGERTVPDLPAENYWFRRHEAAYRAVEPLLPVGRVLEIGVGEGYGADLLGAAGYGADLLGAAGARRLTGLDYDAGTLAHVRRRYPAVAVARGNAVALPVRTGAVAAVVSMQLIEHLWDQPAHLSECARVLAPGGTLVLSTPNRLTFSPGYDPATDRPRNIYHSRELSPTELAGLVAAVLPGATMYGLHAGARLAEVDARCRRRYGTDLVEAQLAVPAAEWPAGLAELVGSVTAADFVLSTSDLDGALDLIVVAAKS
ncbi:class I SAM-dependent methyltransferase [Actinocatenispora sera]|uniref:Methyltransferase n=1 Tax=Actinocatenispora sera TaxID=390989 RepID=A0A810L6M8_9ACTN|nr:class I SAM-dependent methyltransferase [Actinocatenispora sera]BCJ31220.1 methyltransferase [Actinocatenispora sera]